MRLLPRSHCALFAVALVLAAPFGSSSPASGSVDLSGLDPNTAGTQPGDPWFDVSAGSFQGFCLSASAGRALQQWSSPLYARPVTLSPSNPNVINFLSTWVAKLLLEEVLGYATLVHDPANNANDVYGDIAAGLADAAVSVFEEPSQDGPELAQYIQAGKVLYYGEHGVASRGGLYFPHRLLSAYPQLSLELWRSYQLSDPLSAQVLSLFLNDSWAALEQGGVNVLLTNQSDPTSLVCPADAVLEALNGGSALADCGCVDGIYYPPQCLPNPRQQCALMFMEEVWLDPGLSQNLVRNLNLSLAVAFISNFSATVLALTQQQRGVLFYAQDVNPLSLALCSQPGSSVPELCFARIFFPTYDVSCDTLTDNSDRGNYTCDYPYQYIVKLSSPQLPALAPRVTNLLTRMSLSPSDARELLTTVNSQAAAGNVTDYKRAACDWLLAHPDEWKGWIAPPGQCGYGDMEYSLSGCSDQAEAALNFAWTSPKACVGGLALPANTTVSCGYASISTQAAAVGVAAVLFALLLAVATDQFVLCALSRHPVGSAALPDHPTRARRLVQTYHRRSQRLGRLAKSLCPPAVGGLLLLTVVPINSLPFSDGQCRARFALLTLGLTTVGSGLLCAMRDLVLSSRRRLQTSSRGWVELRWVGAIALANIAILACVALDASSVGAGTQIVSGFVSVPQPYCQPPSLVITGPLLAVNLSWTALLCLTWGRFALSLLLRSLAQQQQAAAASALVESEKKPTLLRPVMWELFLLLSAAVALWLILLAVLLPSLVTSSLYEDNRWVIAYQATTVDTGAALLGLLLVLPSLRLARLCSRRRWRRVRDSSASGGGESSTRRSTTAWMGDTDSALTAVLADPVLLACLTTFMESTFDAENVRFLGDVRAFNARVGQRRADLPPRLLLAEACALFSTYLAPNAPSQVNVSSEQLKVVNARLDALVSLSERHPSPSSAEWEQIEAAAVLCFSDVSKECLSLLRVNAIPRFLSSASGERANGLVEWAEQFDILSRVEQRAVLSRCTARLALDNGSEQSGAELSNAPRAAPTRRTTQNDVITVQRKTPS